MAERQMGCGDAGCVVCSMLPDTPMKNPFRHITNVKAVPSPPDAARPTIVPIGNGKWKCRISGEFAIGYGTSPVYAWNAWVMNYTSSRNWR